MNYILNTLLRLFKVITIMVYVISIAITTVCIIILCGPIYILTGINPEKLLNNSTNFMLDNKFVDWLTID